MQPLHTRVSSETIGAGRTGRELQKAECASRVPCMERRNVCCCVITHCPYSWQSLPFAVQHVAPITFLHPAPRGSNLTRLSTLQSCLLPPS